MSSEKVCTQGDDSTCITYFGEMANEFNTCCWKTEMIEIPEVGGTTTLNGINTYIATLKSHGLSGELENPDYYCKNNWIDLYPNSTIPLDYEYTDAYGFKWRSSCSNAIKTIVSLSAVTSTLLMTSF